MLFVEILMIRRCNTYLFSYLLLMTTSSCNFSAPKKELIENPSGKNQDKQSNQKNSIELTTEISGSWNTKCTIFDDDLIDAMVHTQTEWNFDNNDKLIISTSYYSDSSCKKAINDSDIDKIVDILVNNEIEFKAKTGTSMTQDQISKSQKENWTILSQIFAGEKMESEYKLGRIIDPSTIEIDISLNNQEYSAV